MAWRCTGETNQELVENLFKANIIKSERVKEAMLHTDRALYTHVRAYEDAPQGIGHAQTISAPHMHAHALELVADLLEPGAKVLDVGSGSGYLTACFARMVAPTGHVVGLEYVPDLVRKGQENIAQDAKDLIEAGVLQIQQGDGWLGLPDQAPFHVIHVGAAAVETPMALLKQLHPDGGRLVVPVGPQDGEQYLMMYIRQGDDIVSRELMGVRYVPLVRDN